MMVHLENDPDTSRWTARVEIDAEQRVLLLRARYDRRTGANVPEAGADLADWLREAIAISAAFPSSVSDPLLGADPMGWLATYRERAIAEICEQLGNPPPAGQHWIEFEPGEPDLPEALLQTATQNRAAKLSRCDVWLLICYFLSDPASVNESDVAEAVAAEFRNGIVAQMDIQQEDLLAMVAKRMRMLGWKETTR